MPTPFTSSQYDDRLPHSTDCGCESCRARTASLGYTEKPGLAWTWRRWLCLLAAGTLITTCFLGALYGAQQAYGREGKVTPVKAPQSLLRARYACPNTATLAECRGALVRAYRSIEWQRRARNKAQAYTSKDVVLDAIKWAAQKTGVPAWRITRIGTCESHLFWLAHNGQYLGFMQLGAQHRSDPIFDQVPWQDPYAQAIHAARFIKNHGESAWQCSSSGGLRW